MWDDLKMSERNDIIALAVSQGITDIDDIRNLYEQGNIFATGGKKPDLPRKKVSYTGEDTFNHYWERAVSRHPKYDTPEWRAFFRDIAFQESGFNPFIVGPAVKRKNGTNDYGRGYFGIMDTSRGANSDGSKMFNWTTNAAGIDLLFDNAFWLMDYNLATINNRIKQSPKLARVIKENNLSQYALGAGAWAAGASGLCDALISGKDRVDLVFGNVSAFKQVAKYNNKDYSHSSTAIEGSPVTFTYANPDGSGKFFDPNVNSKYILEPDAIVVDPAIKAMFDLKTQDILSRLNIDIEAEEKAHLKFNELQLLDQEPKNKEFKKGTDFFRNLLQLSSLLKNYVEQPPQLEAVQELPFAGSEVLRRYDYYNKAMNLGEHPAYRGYDNGGNLLYGLEYPWTMEDESNYRAWRENLPPNLRYTNDNDYDMRGAYKAGMQPQWVEEDKSYHLASRDPQTGRYLKAPHHNTTLIALIGDAEQGYQSEFKNGALYTNVPNWAKIPGKQYEGGGKIHIKPSKRGTFTAAAKKHGKSVQAFASQVLANKENYSPAMVKKANFARNAAKWHGLGGNLFLTGGPENPPIYYTGEDIARIIKNAPNAFLNYWGDPINLESGDNNATANMLNELIYLNDVTIDGGRKPEVIISPSSADKHILHNIRTLFPDKDLRNSVYDYVSSALLNNIDAMEGEEPVTVGSENELLNNIIVLLNLAKNPTIHRGEILPFLDTKYSKTGALDLINSEKMAYYFHPFGLNDMYNINSAEDYIAELSHALQYYAPHMRNLDTYSLRGDMQIFGKDGYDSPGNPEYNAHNIIEPTVDTFIEYGKTPEDFYRLLDKQIDRDILYHSYHKSLKDSDTQWYNDRTFKRDLDGNIIWSNTYKTGGNLFGEGGPKDKLPKTKDLNPTGETLEEYYTRKSNEITRERKALETQYAIPIIPSKIISLTGDTPYKDRGAIFSENLLDSIYKNASAVGLPFSEGLGLVAQESTLANAKNRGMGVGYDHKNNDGTWTPRRIGMKYSPVVVTSDWSYINDNPYNDALAYARKKSNTELRLKDGLTYTENLMKKFNIKTPPLLHAFELFKTGKYNTGEPDHRSKVIKRGEDIIKYSPEVQRWMKRNNVK